MYFTGDLSIDPAQMTKFKRVKPSKAFGKLFYYLTAGSTGTKQEIETFTAVSVLQQLNQAVRKLGINNIVRLARDAEDLYLDTKGRTDDLREAMEAFASRHSDSPAEFELLQLVLEHEDEKLKYLIDVRVRRQHEPGVHPIAIHLNGAVKNLRVDPVTGTAAEIKGKLSTVFADQDAYDAYVADHRSHFDEFIRQLKIAIGESMEVDYVTTDSKMRMVRPKSKKGRASDIEHDYEDDTVELMHAGYPGFDDAFFYAFVWSELCFDHNIRVQDTSIVDDGGHPMLDVGSEGFDAGAADTLDPSATFEAPPGDDVTYHSGHAYESEFEDASLHTASSVTPGSDGSSWLDSFSSDSSSSSDSGASSCASSGGSSCGSSCGGCGGGD